MGEETKVQIRDVTEASAGGPLAFELTFIVECLGENGVTRVGNFTTKRIGLGDLQQYGVLKSQMAGGLPQLDFDVAWINERIALCQVALTDKPKWWDPAKEFDDELLDKVYKRVRAFQDSFRVPVGERRTQAQDGGSKTA